MTLGRLPDEIRSIAPDDYAMLHALYAVQPWGAERDNFHMAVLAAQQANLNRRKGAAVISPTRYMFGNREESDRAKVLALRAYIHHESKEIH